VISLADTTSNATTLPPITSNDNLDNNRVIFQQLRPHRRIAVVGFMRRSISLRQARTVTRNCLFISALANFNAPLAFPTLL